MQIRFFAVPSCESTREERDLNQFLGGHRIVHVDRQFVPLGAESYWAVAVTYVVGDGASPVGKKKPRVDYKEVLSTADFALYASLRQLRKELSEAEGVPAYALFNNEQLATMVTRRAQSLEDLRAIDGIGDARVRKYGAAFLAVLREQAEVLTTADGSASPTTAIEEAGPNGPAQQDLTL